ncbi:hypothetical protein TRAPUB_7980 [Trametes pubescens]|uniref:Retroviral polymerase SH3-like domain-containing protein n=1 Tax=Trametes pubescens TaxID=154538 RepID=A0A1M2V1X8_TRAPU|nr:hypothetical protein TRAPUB_7980 [Trametes pubescens]
MLHVNQTLINLMVAMLIESSLPNPTKGLKGKTPYQTLFSEQRKIDVFLFHLFGCLAYALIPKNQWQGKFAPKGRKCIFLGYEYGKQVYRLMDVTTRKVFSS